MPPADFIEALRQEIGRLENTRRPSDEAPISTGCDGLDRLLPAGGFRRGSLIEWLAVGEGSGAETLALLAAREACREGGAVVVLDQALEFYPPAAVRLGLRPEAVIVVQAVRRADNLWALDQSLRCPGVAAVLAWPDKLDDRTFRRLQLAAEQGGGLGFLFRPENARHEPSWAEVRLLVEPLSGVELLSNPSFHNSPRPLAGERHSSCGGARRRLKIQLLHSRGGAGCGSVEVEIDDETHTVHLAPGMAHPADRRRAAGA